MPLALIPSPLVGPFTWTRVADVLSARGVSARLLDLRDQAAQGRPYWQQQAETAAADLNALPSDGPLVLVGHSGAGALLPAIRAALVRPVAGYVFVDAGIPVDGQSRLATFGDDEAGFRAFLAGGGRFPNWTAADLQATGLAPEVAERLAADQRPRDLPFWDEPIPVFSGWPDAPGAFLLLTETYRRSAEQAWAMGWPVRELPAGHFHMLVEPEVVAEALLDLIGRWTG